MCALVLLLLWTRAVGGDPCNFECWLAHIRIVIADAKIVESGVVLRVQNLICQGIHLQKIQSSFVEPLSYQLAVDVDGVTCDGDWEYHLELDPKIRGSGGVHADTGVSSGSGEVVIHKGTDGLASGADLTACSMAIDIKDLHFTGSSLSSKLLELFRTQIASLIQTEVHSEGCASLGALVHTNLTQALQDVNKKIQPYLKPTPPLVPPPAPPGTAVLQGNSLVGLLSYIANTVVGTHGVLNINKVMSAVTSSTGSYTFQGLADKMTFLIPSALFNITVGIETVSFGGLDTWTNFHMFQPKGHYTLAFETAMEHLSFNVTFFVNVSLPDEGPVRGVNLYEEAMFYFNGGDLSFDATLFLAASKDAFEALQPAQFLNENCVSHAFFATNITQLLFNASIADVLLTALSGDVHEVDLDDAIDNALLLFITSYKPVLPAFFNGVVAGPGRLQANAFFSDFIAAHAAEPCPPDSNTFSAGFGTTQTLAAASFAVFFMALFIYMFYRGWMTILDASEEKASLLPDERPGAWWTHSLMFSPRYPKYVGIAVPGLLLVGMGTYISSHFSLGAGVYPEVRYGDAVVELPSVFTFTLGNTVRDMWKAKVYPLAIIIALLSCAWPYAKLLLMLACWVVPLRYMTESRRENVLMLLDMLGKWSLVDAFVMCLMIVAFNFHLVSPADPESGAPAGATVVTIYVEPLAGFYSFLMATMLSLLSTHLVLYLHREDTQVKVPERIEKCASLPPRPEVLSAHAFRHHNSKITMTRGGRWTVTFLLVAAITFIVVGNGITAFAFHFHGALALVLDYIAQPTDLPYSVVSVGQQMPFATKNPSGAGIRWIQATFFMFVYVVPVTHLFAVLLLWTVPLRNRMQQRLYILTEVLNAWASCDVFVLAIITALLELKQFAGFMVGNKCDFINPILAKYFDGPLDGVDNCFEVTASLLEGCWLLFASNTIYNLVGNFVMRLAHKVLEEREACKREQLDMDHRRRREEEDAAEEQDRGRCARLADGAVRAALRLALVRVEDGSGPRGGVN